MTENTHRTAVIVGAGHAAGELATSLRDNGWSGRIVLIGDEPHLPYHRPPLSKAYLSGAATAESLLIKSPATYMKANVEIINNTRVLRIDRQRKSVELANGEWIGYDKLVLTTGGRPRPLSVPKSSLAEQSGNFHYLRTLGDVDAMRRQFEPGMRLVIVGGGYVGLEVAAVAVKLGLKVTVLEAFPRVLARVTAPELSAFYERKHREAGVEIRTGVQVSDVEMDRSGDAVSAVLCADGTRVPADLVVVGIGLIPNTELAQEAGLTVDNGILVDEHAQTSDPDIYAAGDCTNHPNASLGRRLRLESVPNALEQARTAAAAICGKQKPYNVIPWFWSDQYDLKLKMVGLSQGYDQLVVRGSPDSDSFSAFYLKDGLVLAADTVNRPPEFMLAKRIIAERLRVDPEQLADDSIPLKSLLPPP
ncbi:3-phenylpropionate/trans-cinnamate dioxygenase ferredoxin reductase subunit [Pseudomonas sp. SJZ103]|uniref:NAD(P)/FAD-dependent oxidoreductase n=1 Tax=unclassified Pseudomonas TaxID=196821 RepID=UPI0011A78608|nr:MULTISPECIES: FAD-dependent oxidoreductase [unclassified Pseudomonas]MBB6290701.1 3-phenylpropionate/trans-cinnamate dioxygenase ferredoxin reductase subunit [Pseudomonas sp. SJZ073]MBB6315571.1 3-phenylpropionate/trans-cinnamate dioxygenase ferredoxin reductase subunit [Pseudomonas sp. JAI120]TWC61592.1 3-phenylpropionate/trans-cinnamate dioxygenase ferredoxin reductase subunit [Pseudomonas sp. SJZ103]TWC78788.1 3-phenylpropionate/trans-cinnamate dioxygenase ferredoxin reductase subunit [Ps